MLSRKKVGLPYLLEILGLFQREQSRGPAFRLRLVHEVKVGIEGKHKYAGQSRPDSQSLYLSRLLSTKLLSVKVRGS
jgi:hypothetical protein